MSLSTFSKLVLIALLIVGGSALAVFAVSFLRYLGEGEDWLLERIRNDVPVPTLDRDTWRDRLGTVYVAKAWGIAWLLGSVLLVATGFVLLYWRTPDQKRHSK